MDKLFGTSTGPKVLVLGQIEGKNEKLTTYRFPEFPLGSDTLGRDILSGIVHGSRVSLLIGLAATAAALGIGVTVGAVAGYFRGWPDDLLMRITGLNSWDAERPGVVEAALQRLEASRAADTSAFLTSIEHEARKMAIAAAQLSGQASA